MKKKDFSWGWTTQEKTELLTGKLKSYAKEAYLFSPPSYLSDFPYKEGNTPYIHVEDIKEVFMTFSLFQKFVGELEFLRKTQTTDTRITI